MSLARKIGAFTLIAILACAWLPGCGALNDLGRPEVAQDVAKAPSELVAEMLQRLQQEQGQRQGSWGTLVEAGHIRDVIILIGSDLFEFDYRILEQEIGETAARVEVEIVTRDFGAIYAQAHDLFLLETARRISEAQADGEATPSAADDVSAPASSPAPASDSDPASGPADQGAALFSASFGEAYAQKSQEAKDFRRTVNFYLVLDAQGRWVIDEAAANDEVVDALYGGLLSAARELSAKAADEDYLLSYLQQAQGRQ
jgi:hypothetical protein